MAGDPITRVLGELALGQKRHELAEFRLADKQENEAAHDLQNAVDTLDPETDAVKTIERGLQRSTTAFILPAPRAGTRCARDCRDADPRPAGSAQPPGALAAESCPG